MNRLSFILILILLTLAACSGPLGPVDLPAGGDDYRLSLRWDTRPSYDGSWFTAVIGSVNGDETELWVRFRLSTTDSAGVEQSVATGGPPPFAAGIGHDLRTAPIVYVAELTRKSYNVGGGGWTWEVVDTEEGVHVAPETP